MNSQLSLQRILRYALIGGLFLVPFIPFIVAPSFFFPFITGKAFAFRILVEILLALWVVLAIYNPQYRPKFSWILGAFAIFVGFIAISDIFFAENSFKAVWSNFERMEGLVVLVHLLAYFLIAGTVLKVENLWERFWQTSIGVSVLIGFYGLLQIAGFITINQGGARLDGPFGNATYLAVYMLFHVFITALFFYRAKNKWAKWFYALIILFQFSILFFTGTRGTMLGVVGGAILTALIIALFERSEKKLKKTAIGGLVALVILIGGFIAIKDTEFVRSDETLTRFATISLQAGETRFRVWDMALEGFKERPLFGWGQEGFNFVFNKYYNPEMYDQESWFDRVHNVFLDWLIAGGILGLLSYLALYVAALFYILKDRNFRVSEKAILLGLLGGYFIHNIFVFDHLISYILFFSFLAYLHASGGREKSFLGEKTLSQMGNMIAGAIVIVVLVLTIWFVNVPAMQTAYAVIQAISPQEGGPVENLKWHKRANEINFIGRQEATEQLLLAAETVARGTNDQELRSTFFEAARSEMLEELERNPNDARTQVLMGSFLNNFNRTQESLGYIERAHELSPMKQQISFLLGLTHIANGNEEKALPLFKEAFESAPQYEEARQMYVVALVYNREFVLADQVLAEYYGADVLPNNQRLLQAYHSVGRFDKVVDIWELRANLNPQNAQTRVSLAAAYYQAGRPQEAIEILRQVIAQVPSFKEQGEELIRQIQAGTL